MTNEKDPNGIAANAPGSKLDAGKVDVGLFFEAFPNAILAVSSVATFGANKYTRGGWKEVPNGMVRYKAAAGRHLLKRHSGELIDPDSGELHLAHEAWNTLAQLEFQLTGKGE